MLGALNYQATFRRPWFHFRRPELNLYFQDNWKATRRLTLNLGLRYELRTPLYDRDNTLLGFDFEKHALVTGTDPAEFVRLGYEHSCDHERSAELRRQSDQL